MGMERMPLENGLPLSFWESYSAFANSGGGTISLKWAGRFESELDDIAAEIRNGLSDRSLISSNILMDSDISVTDDGIEVHIPGADRYLRPVYVGDSPQTGTFVRFEGMTVRCSSQNTVSMIRDSSDAVMDSDAVSDMTVDSLNPLSIKKFREAVDTKTENNVWKNMPDDVFLSATGAAVDCGGWLRPTVAGMLLFSNNFASSMKYRGYFLEYSEAGYHTSSEDGSWSGNMADFIDTVFERFDHRIGDASEPAKELLLNALAHSDFNFGKGVSVKTSPRSLSITNYGLFRTARERAAEGEKDRRNPALSRLLNLISPHRNMGSAISALESSGYGVSVNENYMTGSVEITVSAVTDGLAENIEGMILEEISADPSVTIGELSARTGINRRKLERSISDMKSAGILGREGSRRSGIWVILDV